MVKSVLVPSQSAAAARSYSLLVAATATAPPALDFRRAFAELERYKREHRGQLSIPTSHPAMSRIIDSLSESPDTIESLSKKRWDDQFAAMKECGEGKIRGEPSLDEGPDARWVLTQREQYKRYEDGISSSLTKKRFGKLKAIGFGSANNDWGSSREEPAGTHENATATAPNANQKVKSETTDEQKTDAGIKLELEDNTGGNGTFNDLLYVNDKDRSQGAAPSPVSNTKRANPVKPKEKTDGSFTSTFKSNGKLKGKCDICEKGDGYLGHNLQRCNMCGLLVHELCYGVSETECKDSNFVCLACKAAGTKVEVNVPSKVGGSGKKLGKKREFVRQRERPKRCVLCNHDKGFHAMHPLLDTNGPEGRQLCIDCSPPKDGKGKTQKELAWVHTLCASVICSNPGTGGCVYGCDHNGGYYSHADEESFSDEGDLSNNGNDSSVSKDDNEKSSDEEGSEKEERTGETKISICSFAIASSGVWAKTIKEHRRELKCFICGKLDNKSLRIPVQCIAGEEGEHYEWKDRHSKDTQCEVAMHVGCARWGCVELEGSHLETIEGKPCKLCYFTPGRDVVTEGDEDDSRDSYEKKKAETVACCFCKAHARDIVLNNPKRKAKRKAKQTSKTTRGSIAGMPQLKQVRRRPSSGSAKAEHKNTRKSPAESQPKKSAEETFKKSLNTLRQRKGKKKKNTPVRVFGFADSKEAKVGFAEENTIQYSGRGRSARALAPPKQMNNRNNKKVSGILKKGGQGVNATAHVPALDPSADNGSGSLARARERNDPTIPNDMSRKESSRKRSSGLVPKMPTGGESCKRTKSEFSGQEVPGKRKFGPATEDVSPGGGSFKRIKTED